MARTPTEEGLETEKAPGNDSRMPCIHIPEPSVCWVELRKIIAEDLIEHAAFRKYAAEHRIAVASGRHEVIGSDLV